MDANGVAIISAGGFIRNHHGHWVSGFRKFLGSGTSSLAKLWALFYGVNLAIQHGCSNLIIESDCTYIIDLISNPSVHASHHYTSLINLCRSKLGELQQFKIQHTLREGNFCADHLTK